MIQTSTTASNTTKSIQNECTGESLSEDDENFYRSAIQDELNNLIRQPQTETIKAILKYSKSV